MPIARLCRSAGRKTLISLLVVVGVSGCAAAGPELAPEPAPGIRLDRLIASDARVARVGHRLSVANADLCPRTSMLAGWALHAASLYSPELAPHARARFGLSGDLPGILSVAPDSPAEQAGLRVGDLILDVDGQPLSPGPERSGAAYEGFAAQVAVIDAALNDGPTRLRVQRGEDRVDVLVEPVRGCAYGYQVDSSPQLYARADADRIFVSSSLVTYLQDDGDLAITLGHELAHAALEHAAQGSGSSDLPWRIRAREREADRTGLYLSARAGYDPMRAGAFWRRFGADHPQTQYAIWGHPSSNDRARILDAVAADILRLKSEGRPIIP